MQFECFVSFGWCSKFVGFSPLLCLDYIVFINILFTVLYRYVNVIGLYMCIMYYTVYLLVCTCVLCIILFIY